MPLAIVFCSLLILLTALEWTIVDRITPFLYFPLLGVAWLSFSVSAIVALVRWYKRRSEKFKAAKPALLHLATLVILLFVPFTNIEIWLDFHMKKAEREAVIQEVQSGKLLPNVPHNSRLISLGQRKRLSAGGNEVMVDTAQGKTYVFFFTYRGILDNYSGFLFVPPGGSPESFGPPHEKAAQLIKLSDQWYFTSRH